MAELTVFDFLADTIFITETWLTSRSSLTLYNKSRYTSFRSVRNNSRGGGALVFIQNEIALTHISTVVTCNNSYNVRAAFILLDARRFLLLSVYRSPGSSTNDTKDMCNFIDFYMQPYHILMASDFNFSFMQWVSSADHCDDSHCERLLRTLFFEHHLVQVVVKPTRGKSILGLMLVLEMLTVDSIEYLPPIAGSDHETQMLCIFFSQYRHSPQDSPSHRLCQPTHLLCTD